MAAGPAAVPYVFGPSGPIVGGIESNDARNLIEDQAVQRLNEWELRLWISLQDYLNNPPSRERQAQAVAIFEEALAWLHGPEFQENHGLRAWWLRGGLADRERGGQYDWYATYYDPIVNDPRLSGTFGPVADLAGRVGLEGWQLVAIIVVILAIVYWRMS